MAKVIPLIVVLIVLLLISIVFSSGTILYGLSKVFSASKSSEWNVVNLPYFWFKYLFLHFISMLSDCGFSEVFTTFMI